MKLYWHNSLLSLTPDDIISCAEQMIYYKKEKQEGTPVFGIPSVFHPRALLRRVRRTYSVHSTMIFCGVVCAGILNVEVV